MKKLLIIFFCLQLVNLSHAQKNTLEYYVGHALANSPLLAEIRNQIRSLSIDSQILRAELRPQVNGISNGLLAPVIGGWGYDEVITNKQELSALGQVTKSIFSNKTIATKLEDLRIQELQAGNSGSITEQDLRKAIIDQYILVFGEQLQLDFIRQVISMLSREEELLKKLTRDNVYKQSDYLAFVLTMQQQQLTRSQLDVQYRYDYSTLHYLAGEVDTSVVALEDPAIGEGLMPDFLHSIFYRQFLLDSLRLVNKKAMVDLNYRPRINLFADAGFNSSFAVTPYKNFGASVGFNVTVPIYDGHQKKLQYAKIDIEERTRLSKRDFFIHQHDQQILQLYQQLRATERLIDEINKQIKYTETLITVDEKLLSTGDIRLVDFVMTLNNYLNAKNLITQNYVSRLKIINQLNYWTK